MLYSKESTRIENRYSSDIFFHTGICAVCGDKFKCRNTLTKYCSQRCTNDAQIARRRAKMEQKRANAKKCTVCGESITQDSVKIRAYCSTACKQKAYRQRVKQSIV